ncbi:hypothetical protein PIB30_085234 [Stylosanthes scabra]|uniref:Uncharacterized protein n=1 Tax=Stylosanthes scabra TaxID=79078 RepID=A0ABU6ZRF3_9FABA|nr:hypothetical protein [Stylosanthes scabra]
MTPQTTRTYTAILGKVPRLSIVETTGAVSPTRRSPMIPFTPQTLLPMLPRSIYSLLGSVSTGVWALHNHSKYSLSANMAHPHEFSRIPGTLVFVTSGKPFCIILMRAPIPSQCRHSTSRLPTLSWLPRSTIRCTEASCQVPGLSTVMAVTPTSPTWSSTMRSSAPLALPPWLSLRNSRSITRILTSIPTIIRTIPPPTSMEEATERLILVVTSWSKVATQVSRWQITLSIPQNCHTFTAIIRAFARLHQFVLKTNGITLTQLRKTAEIFDRLDILSQG